MILIQVNEIMKRIVTPLSSIILLAIVFLSGTINSRAAIYTAIASGNFNDPATWQGGQVPPPVLTNDQIQIQAFNVILDTNVIMTGSNSIFEVNAGGSISPGPGPFFISLSGCGFNGDGTIDIDSMYLAIGATQFNYLGSIQVEKLACGNLDCTQPASMNAKQILHLKGTLNVGPGTLQVDNNALIIVEGGTLPKTSASQISLVQPYDVEYRGTGDTTGLELLGVGLREINVAANTNSVIELTNDLTIDFSLRLTSGIFDLGGHRLTFSGSGDLLNGGSGNIAGTPTSSIFVNNAGGLTGVLNFPATGTMMDTISVNATSAGATVKTGGEVEVKQMILSAGMVDLGAGRMEIASGGMLTGGNSNSYFIATGGGTLAQSVGTSGNTFYPVGTATHYAPAKIYGNSGHTADPVNVSIMEGVFREVTTGKDIAATEPVVNKTWLITSGSTATVDVDVELQWTVPQEINSFDRNKCYVSTNSGTKWEDNTGTMAGTSAGLFTQRRDDVSSLNAFAVIDEAAAVTVGELSKADKSIAIYPNPATNTLYIDYTGTVSIYNMQGQLMSEQQVMNGTVDVSKLPAGVYQLKADVGTARFTKQ